MKDAVAILRCSGSRLPPRYSSDLLRSLVPTSESCVPGSVTVLPGGTVTRVVPRIWLAGVAASVGPAVYWEEVDLLVHLRGSHLNVGARWVFLVAEHGLSVEVREEFSS